MCISAPIAAPINAAIKYPVSPVTNYGALLTITESFTVTISDGNLSNTLPLSNSYDVNKDIIIWEGWSANGTGTDVEESIAGVYWFDASTIIAVRGAQDGIKDVTVRGHVVAVNPDLVLYAEYAQIAIATNASSGTATLTKSFPLSSSFGIYLGASASGGTSAYTHGNVTFDVTDTNTATATRRSNSATIAAVSYGVAVRLKDDAFDRIERCSVTRTSYTGATDTYTYTNARTDAEFARTIHFFGGNSSTQSLVPSGMWRASPSKTGITWTREGTTSANHILKVTSVQLKSGIIKSIQRGTKQVSGAATGTVTITSVTANKSFLNVLGWSVDATANGTDEALGYGVITNATTLTFGRAGTAGAITFSYEVVESN